MGSHQAYLEQSRPPKAGGHAIASLVCGIVSILFFGIIIGPVAIGLGVWAKRDIKKRPTEVGGGGLALGGIITGAVGLVLWIIWIVWYVIAVTAVATAVNAYDDDADFDY